MNSELHLFVIWSNAKYMEKAIIDDISVRFKVIGIHTIEWNKNRFTSNLIRLYGENLPPNSNKEVLCGNGPFTVVVVMDEQPLYRPRMTSKGSSIVNVNMFDSKEMYRHWTGGGHMIHGTNSDKEFRHDVVLLTGYSKEDYLNKASLNRSILRESIYEMPGEDSWRDINQMLYVLNETTDYVVLRNYDGVFRDYSSSIHGDIDILTNNRYLAKIALNAKPTHKSNRRVQHLVKIGSGGTKIDIRYIGDNYYCKTWEEKILSSRYLDENGIYRASEENYIYPLLYHALVQKKAIADDYMSTFSDFFPGCSKTELKDRLLSYMDYHHYYMIEPYDYSVYFNPEVTGKKMSFGKLIRKGASKVFKM